MCSPPRDTRVWPPGFQGPRQSLLSGWASTVLRNSLFLAGTDMRTPGSFSETVWSTSEPRKTVTEKWWNSTEQTQKNVVALQTSFIVWFPENTHVVRNTGRSADYANVANWVCVPQLRYRRLQLHPCTIALPNTAQPSNITGTGGRIRVVMTAYNCWQASWASDGGEG